MDSGSGPSDTLKSAAVYLKLGLIFHSPLIQNSYRVPRRAVLGAPEYVRVGPIKSKPKTHQTRYSGIVEETTGNLILNPSLDSFRQAIAQFT